ncbi:MAG: aminotransferase class V-fold PLP-dependent enzyme, partial [Leptospiraceae bacterium]|nr:aminotransferase class V-fold PLP-dependent enzyme [Leptospiraceae bacterium]
YGNLLGDLHTSVARMLRTDASCISFLKNTAEGLSMIADAFPFEKGDRIISYVHEYPSNHYPWLIQQRRRGVELKLLPDRDLSIDGLPETMARGWSLEDLEGMLDDRVRMVAVSHVQFTSGFAADIRKLGELCKRHDVFLVIDAAQSLGALELYPEEMHIDAIAASGWKWLMGPIGTGLLYTSARLRERLDFTMGGADMMTQGDDYLDHRWQPYSDGRRFEYSTASLALTVAMQSCVDEIFNAYGVSAIQSEIYRLQNLMLAGLNADFFRSVRFQPSNRSGIRSFVLPDGVDPIAFSKRAIGAGVFCSARGGYLRLAPHFHNTEEEIQRAVEILNRLAGEYLKQ